MSRQITRDFREMREMLRAMQAGELTVSRGIEILEMWEAGNWNDSMLPPVRQDLIEEDSMPVEIIDRVTKQRDELLTVLVNSRNCLESANEMGDGPIVDTIWYGPAETLFEYMDGVILGGQGIKPVIQESLITEKPAILFFPAGSLGEEVES
jgi:hypothetical protein